MGKITTATTKTVKKKKHPKHKPQHKIYSKHKIYTHTQSKWEWKQNGIEMKLMILDRAQTHMAVFKIKQKKKQIEGEEKRKKKFDNSIPNI